MRDGRRHRRPGPRHHRRPGHARDERRRLLHGAAAPTCSASSSRPSPRPTWSTAPTTTADEPQPPSGPPAVRHRRRRGRRPGARRARRRDRPTTRPPRRRRPPGRGRRRRTSRRARRPADHLSAMKDKRPLWVSLLAVVAIAVVVARRHPGGRLVAQARPRPRRRPVGRLRDPHPGHHGRARHHHHHPQRAGRQRLERRHRGQPGHVQVPGRHPLAAPSSAPGSRGRRTPSRSSTSSGKTAQLFFRPALCFAPALHGGQGRRRRPPAPCRPARRPPR